MSFIQDQKDRSAEAAQAVPGDQALAGWELASIVSSVLMAEWIFSSVAVGSRLIVLIPLTLSFALMILSHRLRKESVRDIGFRFDNFFHAGLLLLFPMLLATILSLIIGRWFGAEMDFQRWHGGSSIFGRLTLGFGWALLQQYVLQGFINRRAQIIWGRRWLSVLVVAAIFAGLHLPNMWLALATFVGGLLWAWAYQRAPNILALALSHSVMTWILVSTLPATAFHHLRIGFKYFD